LFLNKLLRPFRKHFIKRAFYEGAQKGVNRDFAKAANDFESQATLDRETLRIRARWLYENNGLIANIDKTIINNSVGNGMKLQVKTDNKTLNTQVEKLWEEWCEPENCDITKRIHFDNMQRLFPGQRMLDGETFVLKRYTKDKKHPFKLQLLESDRVGSYNVKNILNGGNLDELYVDGIILDSNGAPKRYAIKDSAFSTKEIRADKLYHYQKIENRSTQYRGVSEYKQTIIDLRNFAAYQSSVIKAARVRANIGYIVETPDIGSYQHQSNDEALEEINGVIVEYLNPGEKIQTIDPKVVGVDYEKFVKSSVRLIAVAREISYELAFRDYSEVNFSSARASIIQDHKRFSNEQWHLVTYLLRPIFMDWLEANILAGNIKVNIDAFMRNRRDFYPNWIPPKREWVDPLKDIRALEREIGLGLTTLKEAAASRGKDIEDLIKEREDEIKMLKKAGIMADDLTPK